MEEVIGTAQKATKSKVLRFLPMASEVPIHLLGKDAREPKYTSAWSNHFMQNRRGTGQSGALTSCAKSRSVGGKGRLPDLALTEIGNQRSW